MTHRPAAAYPYFDAPTPLALAHRGGAAYGPNRGLENSLAAFRTARSLGYRYLETDVHATADGVLVAFHDDRLDRVTDGVGAVADLPYASVAEARIGGREPIPRLEELLEELPGARLNIDVKSNQAVAPLIEAIRRHEAIDRVCVGSFSERRLRAVRTALGPKLATAAGQFGVAALRFGPSVITRMMATPSPVLQIPDTHHIGGVTLRLVTPGLLRKAHALGKQVHVWTVDDPSEMARLLDLGVDGIVTDRIDVLARVLAGRGVALGQ
ncbi:MAG: glycerophosphodiester phosphodiesterase family protein [Nostocoides sp.]